MNPREHAIKKELEAQGYTVLRRGWPDFLAFKEADGKLEVKGVEVKVAANDFPSKHQAAMHDVLRRFGLNIEVVISKTNVYRPEELLEEKSQVDGYRPVESLDGKVTWVPFNLDSLGRLRDCPQPLQQRAVTGGPAAE
jgi:hypothetical protein